MAITASSPDAFFDGEDFAWQQTILQEDGATPLDLTGSRLFVRFWDVSKTLVGVCDSAASDGSLVIDDAAAGAVSFRIPAAGRTWSPPFLGLLRLGITADVYGDLYRYPPGSTAPVGICRIDFTVLPGTGAPAGSVAPPAPTLITLALSTTTATAGTPFSASVIGRMSGSLLTASASDGTALSVNGSTVSGTFAGAGTPTITLTETVVGATNSPKQTAIPITVSSGPVTPTSGNLDFSNPANSGLLAALGA